MENKNYKPFKQLFLEAYEKCFGEQMVQPLSETESKHFHNQIFEVTGLTVGWRSLKNYSVFVLDNRNIRAENPSVASLDTLARFVLKAPMTNEIKRKEQEAHHPYWFLYKDQSLKPEDSNMVKPAQP